MGIADLADALEMSRPTTHRYVVTLVELECLEQIAGCKYRLSRGVTDLGMRALECTGLREHAHYLKDLRSRTGYTTSLAVLDRQDVLYVVRARSYRQGQYKIDLNVRVASRLPAYCTALGKVLLAHLPEPDQAEFVRGMELTKRAPNTITTKKALLGALEHVREEGMASSEEEYAPGLVAIAAPVRDDSGEVVAAINMAAHTSMTSLAELSQHHSSQLLTTAEEISVCLFYRRDEEAAL
jgi:IclR family pca regulon transcriptional regulator